MGEGVEILLVASVYATENEKSSGSDAARGSYADVIQLACIDFEYLYSLHVSNLTAKLSTG